MIPILVVGLDALLTLGFCIFVGWALRQWRGLWRWALGVPIMIIVAAILSIVNAIRMDPTAHNLWPLEIMAWLGSACVFVGLLHLARWISNRGTGMQKS